MADYYPLIARAIAGLDPNAPGESRRALYERARTVLIAQLRSVQPPLSESEITRERLSLEEAVRKVESEAAQRAREASRRGEYADAFHHLERAHILSQRQTIRHVQVHWLMLKHGIVTRNPREIAGQSVRIIAAALFSRIWVPMGNTGGANVGAMRSMPIPDDLRQLLERHTA